MFGTEAHNRNYLPVVMQTPTSGGKCFRTLVISTDPAHSLGDALDQDVSGGKPVRVMGLDNLSAMEVRSIDRY